MNKKQINNLHHLAEIGRISLGVFHDLTNSLNCLNLIINQLERDKTKYKIKKYFKLASLNCKIMEDLLLSANKYYFKPLNQNFIIKNEVKKIVDLLNFNIKKNNIIISIDIEKNLVLRGSIISFKRIILNLISNSIDACLKSSKKEKEIIIKAHQNSKYIIIEIIDNGCGILKKDSLKLFTPFYSTKNNINLGIGLCICKDLIKNDYKGQISLINNEAKTIFQIKIPCKNS